MDDAHVFPRSLTGNEERWLDFLLPEDRPGYRSLRDRLRPLLVLGEGRWGNGDLVLGAAGTAIDITEGMQPVVAYGEIGGAAADTPELLITLSVHQPNDDGLVEFQIDAGTAGALPSQWQERFRWTYSQWMPGDPCPAFGTAVREVQLNSRRDLLLVIAPARRVLWIHDAYELTNLLIPVTNYYNELMLLKGIRDPHRALDHRWLFLEPNGFTDAELRRAFARYNRAFPKVDPVRVAEPVAAAAAERSIWQRILDAFRGKGTN